MSEAYVSYVGSQDVKNHRPIELKLDRSYGTDSWMPREKIPWTPELSIELLAFFEKVDYPFREITMIPFKDPLRSEIRRFFISLDAYIESPHPVIPYKDILYGNTLKDYAQTLKRIKRKSFETQWRVNHFAFPEWWEEVPAYAVCDIGDIFNYSYCIFFEEEDPEDYLYGMIPVVISQESICKFKKYLSGILPDRDSFQKIEEFEVLSKLSSSIAFNKDQMKSVPHYKLKDKRLFFSKERHVCKRTVISVSPNNTRDTVLLDPSDLNTISLIDQQIMEILGKMPGHIHLRDKDRINTRLNSMFDNYKFFLQRDLQKEGITKPRELLKAILEVLHDAYPDIEIFGYTSFYDNFELLVGDEIIRPLRGHGLGMANCMTTLMQLAINEWIIDELTDDIPDMHNCILCLNDDFTAGFNSDEHVEAYWDKEDEVMNSLSLLREPTKSFQSEYCFVLAERYFTSRGEYEKISYQLREALLPLACYNITHAKSYFAAAQIYINSDLADRYLNELTSYWGYEFFPSEFNYPYIFGGWMNENIRGVDLSLYNLEKLPFMSYVPRAYNAMRQSVHKYGKGEIYNSPIYILLGIPNIPEEFWGHFDRLPISLLTEKYGRPIAHSSRLFREHWDKIYNKRQDFFKEDFDICFDSLMELVIKDYPTKQFYPNGHMTKCFHKGNIIKMNICDPYIDPNPKLALVSKYNETNYKFKESFSIRFTERDDFKSKEIGLYPKDIARALKNEDLSPFFTGRPFELYIPDDDFKTHEAYLNPVRICEVTALLNWGYGVPEPFERFRNPLIDEKKSIFNRLFSFKELEKISSTQISRENLKVIVDYVEENDDDLIEVLDYLLQKVNEERIIERSQLEEYERDHFNLTESSRGAPFELADNHIDIFDLLEDTGKFWILRERSLDELEIPDELARNMFCRLCELVVYLTYPGLRTEQERRDMLHREEENFLMKQAIKAHGIWKFVTGDFFDQEGSDDDDPFGSLF